MEYGETRDMIGSKLRKRTTNSLVLAVEQGKRFIVGKALAFVDTIVADRERTGQKERGRSQAGPKAVQPPNTFAGMDRLMAIAPEMLRSVREALIDQENTYQRKSTERKFSSLWAHSARVARIAHHIAGAEGWETTPALLAGLLHDTGKFAHGSYHENDIPEEKNAVRFAERILAGTIYEKWIPIIGEAILSTYLEGEATSDIGRAVYDADCIDKLGNMGIAQFFAKRALRRQYLDEDVLIRTSIELTYAYHAPDTLKTATGRALAKARSSKTRRFYTELLDEWRELGLGGFNIIEEDIAGIVCILVVPDTCPCGGRLALESDIRDSVKCRSVVMTYRCMRCGTDREFSFCLPNVKGLPGR
jgi:HD superfamily phosphodiesterase